MEVRHAPWCYVPGREEVLYDFAEPPTLTPSQARQLRGFDVDVARALAGRLSMTLHIVPTSWLELDKGLVQGRYDAILSAWTPRPDTPEAIAATTPYYDWGLVVVARREDTRIRSLQDLDGLIVGHYRDPVVEKALLAMGHGRYQVGDSSVALFRQLKAGTVDAILFDSLPARWRVARDPSLRLVGEPLNRLGYHVGVLRVRTDLLAKLQAAVSWLAASPEMAAIRKRWEGGGPP
jgi:polar amino acid transport system substrate-binding protein